MPTGAEESRRPGVVPLPIVRAALRAAWAPMGVFLLHAFLSRVLHAYVRYPPLDIPMHFLGGVVIAYFFATCLHAVPAGALAGSWRGTLLGVTTFALTCTAASFWEFAEFFSDHLFGTRAQVSLEDTLSDMALGMAGGLIYLLLAAWMRTREAGSKEIPG